MDGGPSGPMVKCGGAEVRMLKSVKCGSNLWRKFADMTGKMPMCGGANMIDCNDDYTLNFIGEFSPNVFLQKKVVCVHSKSLLFGANKNLFDPNKNLFNNLTTQILFVCNKYTYKIHLFNLNNTLYFMIMTTLLELNK